MTNRVKGTTRTPALVGGCLAALAGLSLVSGCGGWVDSLACHDDSCQWTREEWARIESLTGLGDPPLDLSNELLPVEGTGIKPNATQDRVVQLGWRLYYDADLSGAPTWKDMLDRPSGVSRASVLRPNDPIKISCATCHDPEQAGGDVTSVPRHVSVGAGRYDVNGQQTLNVAHFRYLYWNGRADSLWSQAAQVMESPVSMNGDRLSVVATVAAKYGKDFGDLLAAWKLPTATAADLCTDLAHCPESDCNVVSGATMVPPQAQGICRPRFPPKGRPGGKAGCQWGSGEPFGDDFDCMRETDRLAVTKAYVLIAKAIAAYEWLLTSTDSAFDRFAAAGPGSTALSPAAQRGLKLFVGKASCIDCHSTPLFSDQEFHNIGVPQSGDGVPTVAECLRPETAGACNCVSGRKCLPWGACEGLQRLNDGPRATQSDTTATAVCDVSPPATPLPAPEMGQPAVFGSHTYARTGSFSNNKTALPPPRLPVVRGAWRTPSLRDVALTPPYMHDGAFVALADVVWHYDQAVAGNDIGPIAVELKPLRLTAGERADLVSFLESLTGQPRRDRDVARPPDSCPRYPADGDAGACP